ncbi:hypothetical protein C731_1201 [Mycolicibacterium hassiacum DSM 44199]|uniref:Uncharacterized protein n=1 Tax=Mycolicibacterium hassiacum (strain DSM 44199 / CIP 105218 / JCM 12690 / 3849) TaxID=1122247 RepID=K5BGH4_MYCHD|nr:hypothetical protein C731_1201 [Mycolicibacterium hassiacum DSM 44199]
MKSGSRRNRTRLPQVIRQLGDQRRASMKSGSRRNRTAEAARYEQTLSGPQ